MFKGNNSWIRWRAETPAACPAFLLCRKYDQYVGKQQGKIAGTNNRESTTWTSIESLISGKTGKIGKIVKINSRR